VGACGKHIDHGWWERTRLTSIQAPSKQRHPTDIKYPEYKSRRQNTRPGAQTQVQTPKYKARHPNRSPDAQNTSPDIQNISPRAQIQVQASQNTSPDTPNVSPDTQNTSSDVQNTCNSGILYTCACTYICIHNRQIQMFICVHFSVFLTGSSADGTK